MKPVFSLKKSMRFGFVVLTAVLWASAQILAHDPKTHAAKTNAPQDITITGEVMDPGCFLVHGAQGMEHKSCAEMCAKAGTTLTVLDEKTKTMYIPISAEHGNPNEKLLPFAGERVTVKGKAAVQYGYHGIAIQSVKRAEKKK